MLYTKNTTIAKPSLLLELIGKSGFPGLTHTLANDCVGCLSLTLLLCWLFVATHSDSAVVGRCGQLTTQPFPLFICTRPFLDRRCQSVSSISSSLASLFRVQQATDSLYR